VDATALDDLGRTVNDLRDRRLLGNVEPKDIRRVTVTRGGKTVVLERKDGEEWRMVEPTKGPAKGGKVDDLVYTARALKWKDVVAPSGEDAARYGLDAPELEIALGGAGGQEIGTVLVGKRDGDRVFVRTKASPAIYALEARQLGDLPNVPDDFKG
jgi:transcription elongation GreA/GreB family factor